MSTVIWGLYVSNFRDNMYMCIGCWFSVCMKNDIWIWIYQSLPGTTLSNNPIS